MGRHPRLGTLEGEAPAEPKPLEGEAPAEPNLEGEAPTEPFQPTPCWDRKRKL
ncbi:hypothetical protein HRbin15_00476 [bacterium HR15]|nr:hypothetical protein HRbin15_00476 [bacterium HR15]